MADAIPWLLVGLGNPGSKYAGHRHNVGFMVVERWLDHHATAGADQWREKFHGRFVALTHAGQRVIVLEPLTYMNRSGQSVAAAAGFHHVPPSRIVVVHDEVDFELARVAIKRGGGHGGHNGLRDLIAALGSPEFVRIRVGIGRPTHGEVADWVLSDFSSEERAVELPEMIERSQGAITAIFRDGVGTAMNAFNHKAVEKSPGPAR
jgi:peptidyl-tRNA hydrolase, PTH1 family